MQIAPLPIAPQASLREAADSATGPFIFLPGGPTTVSAEELTVEYTLAGKPFLLGPRGLTGVYPAETRWLLPRNLPAGDRWMRRHLGPLIAVSPNIPADPNVFYHTGEAGDILAALPVMRQLGGGALVIGNHLKPEWGKFEGPKFNALAPLLRVQPYLTDVRFTHGDPSATRDFSTFREIHHRGRTLAHSQAEWLGVPEFNLSPWIHNVPPSSLTAGKIVVARTPRYQNRTFPWASLLARHHARMIFVGHPDEYRTFLSNTGHRIPHQPTANLLEVAQLIAGSDLFIGNQSSPCWIAMGLGHRLIQETSADVPDAIIPRPNAQFCTDGRLGQPEGLPFPL